MKTKLILGDCTIELKSIPSKFVDLCVTDPAYKTISGGKSKYARGMLKKNDGKIFDENDTEFVSWIPEIYRVLKPQAHFYVMSNVLNIYDIWKVSIECGFILHNILVWKKQNCTPNRWYMKNAEFTLFFRKGKAFTINNPSSKMVHEFDNPVGNKIHPTEKPVDLMMFYIENSSRTGDVILDPFMGSGSTGVAAKQLNRNFIGIEKDEKYYNIACERIK